MNRYNIRFLIPLLIIFLSVLCLNGCAMTWSKPKTDPIQTEYHDEIRDLEKAILDACGDYIYIDDVYINQGDKESALAQIYIKYLRQYIYDETATASTPPLEIAEHIREEYNHFMEMNPNYFLSDYTVYLFFSVPQETGPRTFENYVEFSNWSLEGDTDKNSLSTLEVKCGQNRQYSYPFGEWNYFYKISDIRIVTMNKEYSMDQILEVADNMPFLKYIVVKDQQTADQASALRPDVKFVSVSGG